MLLDSLKAIAVEKGLLSEQDAITPEVAFLLVRDMPYTRASSRDPEIVINEWRGTCSGKHYLLKELFLELGIASRLIACTTVDHLDPKKYWGEMRKLLRESNGKVVDVHNYLILELPTGEMVVDATWPLSSKGMGTIINETFVMGVDQHIAAEPIENFVVPDDQDPQEYKNQLLREHFTQEELEQREALFKTIFRLSNNRYIKLLVRLDRFFKRIRG